MVEGAGVVTTKNANSGSTCGDGPARGDKSLIAAGNRRFQQSFLGRELPAITLHTARGKTTTALTDNFLEVQLEGHLQPNQSICVVVTGVTETGMTGKLAS